ncbi:MAG TPA: bifunctional diaminohydroxyphosphoribosylaminopyrimidine deaminase/5-amino-6-(5-phosphoribosylamino)uracil reductase RibD [Magnetovibrio sp.]
MSATEPRDLDFMGAALSLARRGLGNTHPNPAVGCILVKDGLVLGRGWTQPGGRPHAETVALAQAGAAARGATAYVTLEPCAHQGVTPPCASALVAAGVKRVVVAITDPDERVAGRGVLILKDAGIEVLEDVRRDDAWRANLGFFLTRTENRPMFTLKLATDQAGNIPGPAAQGDAKWITSPAARARGHLLRANHDAVLFGIGTVLSDDPAYTCRLQGLNGQSPVRVLLDSKLRLPMTSTLLNTIDTAPLWVVCGAHAQGAEALEARGAIVLRAPSDRPEATWVAQELAAHGQTRVLIESGPLVATAFLKASLVDEIAWFRAQRTLGQGSEPAFHGNWLEKLAFERQAVLQAGPDLLELYIRKA